MGLFNFFSKRKIYENANLEKVMMEMSLRPVMKTRRVLYAELLKSTLLLPTPSPLESSTFETSLKEIQLVTQPGPKNELVWIAFTSKEALRQWRPQFEDAYVAIQGTLLFALAVQNRVENILINLAGPVSGKITGMELQMLAEGILPRDEDGNTKNTKA